MAIVKWDPIKDIALLQGRINRLFNDAFPQTPADEEEFSQSAWRPLADIYETSEGFMIEMDLSGVAKEDVGVEIKNNRLVIAGTRPPDQQIPREAYLRRERPRGRFQRAFALQTAVAPEDIKAVFKNGVLTIFIPNPREEIPKKISVDSD